MYYFKYILSLYLRWLNLVELESLSSSSNEGIQNSGKPLDINFAINYNKPDDQFNSHSSTQIKITRRNKLTTK